MNEVGDFSFVLAGMGLVVFTVLFLASVRWWTDTLGRVMAGVLAPVAVLLILSMVRLMGVPLPGLLTWRAILYTLIAAGVWSGTVAFIWAQFFAPRRKKEKVNADQ